MSGIAVEFDKLGRVSIILTETNSSCMRFAGSKDDYNDGEHIWDLRIFVVLSEDWWGQVEVSGLTPREKNDSGASAEKRDKTFRELSKIIEERLNEDEVKKKFEKGRKEFLRKEIAYLDEDIKNAHRSIQRVMDRIKRMYKRKEELMGGLE